MVSGIILAIRERGLALAGRGRRSDRPARGQGTEAEGDTPKATGVIHGLRDRGFGYIARDLEGDRSDLFFHRSAVAGDGFDRLNEGERVSFDEEPDPRDRNRRRAVNVRLAGKG